LLFDDEKRKEKNTPAQLDQDSLHRVLALPLGEAGQLLGVDDAVAGVDAGQVDLADELDGGRLIRVLVAAVHLDAIDSVLVDGMGRAEDRAVPVAHEKILGIFQPVAAGLGAETFFALLELLQQAEVAGDLGRHDGVVVVVLVVSVR
jgi:hypothetical protein